MDAQIREEVALLHSRFCAGLADQSRMLIVYELYAQAERAQMAQLKF